MQQNTVAHLREAIKPRAPTIHDFSTQYDSSDAAPSPKEEAYPELLSIEVVTALESDPGLTTEQLQKKEDESIGEETAAVQDEKPEFMYREGRLGASDDEASFSERRKADKLRAAQAEKQNVLRDAIPQEETSDEILSPKIVPHEEDETKPKARPYLGSVYEEVKRVLESIGKREPRNANELKKLAEQYAEDPDALTAAERRKMFLEQLAQGKSPDVVKNPWEYRRRSWL